MRVEITKVYDKGGFLEVKALIDGKRCSFGVAKSELDDDPAVARLQIARKALDLFPPSVERKDLLGEIAISDTPPPATSDILP